MKSLLCLFVVLSLAVLGSCADTDNSCQCLKLPDSRKTLRQFHDLCNSNAKSRSPQCVAAMSRYCNVIKFPWYEPKFPLLAASREHGQNVITFSCIRVTLARQVTLSELKSYHNGCTKNASQSSQCLAAIHRFCLSDCGSDAGLAQEIPTDGIFVTCFKASLKKTLPISDLTNEHGLCNTDVSSGDNCFAAASRWCIKRGHTGGITQEVGGDSVLVACYKGLYSTSLYA